MNFTTHTNENKNIDFDFIGLEKLIKEKQNIINVYSINETIATAIIDWEFYFETRSWGVKDIGAYVSQIKNFEIDLEYYENESNEFEGIENELFLDITELIKDFEILSEHVNDKLYCITNVQVDFDTKQITINF
tara:strand:- start:139 stop:540 length:402 start_codon:yes stop_codon:yes gene_type:complete